MNWLSGWEPVAPSIAIGVLDSANVTEKLDLISQSVSSPAFSNPPS